MKNCLNIEIDNKKCSSCHRPLYTTKHRWKFLYETKRKFIDYETKEPTESRDTSKIYVCIDCGQTYSTNVRIENAIDEDKIKGS